MEGVMYPLKSQAWSAVVILVNKRTAKIPYKNLIVVTEDTPCFCQQDWTGCGLLTGVCYHVFILFF